MQNFVSLREDQNYGGHGYDRHIAITQQGIAERALEMARNYRGSKDREFAASRFFSEAEADAFVMRSRRADLLPQDKPLGNFLRPGGAMVGERGQTGIRVVPEAEFWPLVGNVTAGARQLLAPINYQGLWLQRIDGRRVDLRFSHDNGWTLGIRDPQTYSPTLPGKVHYTWP